MQENMSDIVKKFADQGYTLTFETDGYGSGFELFIVTSGNYSRKFSSLREALAWFKKLTEVTIADIYAEDIKRMVSLLEEILQKRYCDRRIVNTQELQILISNALANSIKIVSGGYNEQ